MGISALYGFTFVLFPFDNCVELIHRYSSYGSSSWYVDAVCKKKADTFPRNLQSYSVHVKEGGLQSLWR